jgi:hypothetical protein
MQKSRIQSMADIALNLSCFVFILCICLFLVHLIIQADRKSIREATARNMCQPTEGHLVKEPREDGHYFCYFRNKDGKTFSRTVLLTGE